LGEEEQEDDGQGDEGAGGHQVVPFRDAMLALEQLQAERERVVLLLGEIDQPGPFVSGYGA
jgi:hypothetical protein